MCQVEWRKIDVKMVAWIAHKRCNNDTWTRQTKGKTKRDKVRSLSFPVAYFSWASIQETAEAIYKQHETPSFATFPAHLSLHQLQAVHRQQSLEGWVWSIHFTRRLELASPLLCCFKTQIKKTKKKLNAVHRIQFKQVLSVSTIILHAELQLNLFLK